MNPPTPPVLPLPKVLPIPVVPALAPDEKLLPTCLGTVVVIALSDFLFWNHRVGLSLAIFVVALAALLVARNWSVARGARVGLTVLLLVVSVIQTAVEISFTNFVIIVALLAVLLAELRFRELPAGWARWSESAVAWIAALGRWGWLVRALNERPRTASNGRGTGERIGRLLVMILPAVILLIVFIAIFATGNRIFHQFFDRGINHFYNWFTGFDFDLGRCFFWFLFATIGLVFLRPRNGAKTLRSWARPLSEWRRADAAMAFWQSALILLALNVLFFAVNTIDVIYLWQRAAPPQGVLARDYLYEGVYSLITATVLAGVVLTFLFQQTVEITSRWGLRALAFAWIAQNFVLIAGVFLRLKLFMDLSDVTEKRVYVACFLLLVTVGLMLLCGHVARGRLASRLIWRNTIATLALFFILQFLNVAGWVVRANFGRFERSPRSSGVNVPYNATLGPDAWPSLVEIAGRLPDGEIRKDLILDLRELARLEKMRLTTLEWRERQWRRDQNAAALVTWAASLGELTETERQSPAIANMHSTAYALRSRD